ncbi:unnamed protein product [Schistosoma margrebowiei]|uniref:Sperm-lysin n=1 Tax=Schistosoma margrebowiei TaxID=48269 RepID=A0AA84ZBE1_9TREM|nr:unnamed protein product [Schistosoma margrebowiei]
MSQTMSQLLFIAFISGLIMLIQSVPYHRSSSSLSLSPFRRIDSLENFKKLSMTQDNTIETIMKNNQPIMKWNQQPGKLDNLFIIKKSINYALNNYTIKPTFYQYVKSCCNREVMRPMGGGHMTGPCCKQLIKFNHFIWLSFPWFKKTITKFTTD